MNKRTKQYRGNYTHAGGTVFETCPSVGMSYEEFCAARNLLDHMSEVLARLEHRRSEFLHFLAEELYEESEADRRWLRKRRRERAHALREARENVVLRSLRRAS